MEMENEAGLSSKKNSMEDRERVEMWVICSRSRIYRRFVYSVLGLERSRVLGICRNLELSTR